MGNLLSFLQKSKLTAPKAHTESEAENTSKKEEGGKGGLLPGVTAWRGEQKSARALARCGRGRTVSQNEKDGLGIQPANPVHRYRTIPCATLIFIKTR